MRFAYARGHARSPRVIAERIAVSRSELIYLPRHREENTIGVSRDMGYYRSWQLILDKPWRHGTAFTTCYHRECGV